MKSHAWLVWLLFAGLTASFSPTFQEKPKSETGSQVSAREMEKFLELHNKLRAQVKVEPLTWSPQLAQYAQEWATHLHESNCKYEHRPQSGPWTQKYGENLGASLPGADEVNNAFKTWESEKKNYTGKPMDMDLLMKAGHYTQVVWKDTKQIGCGKIVCKERVIFVCNYDPPGNQIEETAYPQ